MPSAMAEQTLAASLSKGGFAFGLVVNSRKSESPRPTTWGLLFARLRAIEYNTGNENLGDG